MDEICCYLNLHTEIERVVLLFERIDVDFFDRLESFIIEANIRKLTMTGFIADGTMNSIQTSLKISKLKGRIAETVDIDYISFDEITGFEEKWALCAMECTPEFVLSAARLQPGYILANVLYDRIDAFRIWEEYKEHADYILIRTLAPGRTSRILEWERRDDTGIELSVVFPTYNVAKYLDECISSLIEWKAPYVEYIFVNDGSPDDSSEVIKKWQKQDGRIKLFEKENGGCASARQLGMENAKGRYIGFVDPDDFVNPRMFNTLLREAMIGSYELAYCGYNEYYENNGTIKNIDDALGWPYCSGVTNPVDIRPLLIYMRVAIWRGIYKKEMLDRSKIHFYTDLKRFDDLPFKVEVLANVKSVVAIPEYLYYYRMLRPGQDVSADDERLYVHFDIFKHLNESIASKGIQELTDYLQLIKIQTHIYAIEKIKDQYKATYVKLAKEDLLTTGDKDRTYRLAKEKIGRDRAELYSYIMEERMDRL